MVDADLQLIQTAILGDGMSHVCSGMDQILEMVTQLVLDKQEQAKQVYMAWCDAKNSC